MIYHLLAVCPYIYIYKYMIYMSHIYVIYIPELVMEVFHQGDSNYLPIILQGHLRSQMRY